MVKDKLDPVMARLARLFLQEDDYGFGGRDRHEKQAGLFKCMVGTYSSL